MIAQDHLADWLCTLCPMHLMLDKTGRITGVGPTLQKLRPDALMVGQRFLELFELTRPRSVTNMEGLLAHSGAKLHLQLRDVPRTALKGVAVPIAQGAVLNLSFGISVLDAVRDYALTSADFAATDLTIELLYLVEAKSAAMEASRKLNQRLQGAMIAAEEQAFTDTLTGLKNRRAMNHVLSRMAAGSRAFALMNLDLDFFKAVNDTMGHAAGDHVLQVAARILVEETRDQDMVARVGGDEFVLMFDGLRDKRRLGGIARRLVARLQEPVPFEGQVCKISASIGTVLSVQSPGPDPADLLHKADLALYASKRAGRGCHTFYEETPTDPTGFSQSDEAGSPSLPRGSAA
ncbi:diguanylate cyclase domain-containing protein [Sedimentitalea todarodis]|uniref:guanylate cyclase n=1 Tax=Sedimentitalea todarodis TaxID=1631240 RepID=A0ABU3VB40_9RHOB|nr:diguanylate cyclase [Sedimentitalea todarodis]MDU9003386.1 diguanylate cyclase [Sedimentitalea todarodis]